MGYVVSDITAAKNYVIANAVALLLTYAVRPSLLRLTMYANSSPSAVINQALSHRIMSLKDYFKQVVRYTGSVLQVYIVLSSCFLNISSILLWHRQCISRLGYIGCSINDAHNVLC